ncbi:MAG: hypothetical protein ABJC74_00885 [Gemmatimonadota bacterium]
MTRSRLAGLAPISTLLLLLAQPLRAQVDSTGLLPMGFGTLSIDDITLLMSTDQLDIRIVPLDERILRLTKPSVDSSLDQLIVQFADQIQAASARSGISTPGLALVTFYSRQMNARYEPEDISILSPGREYRPVVMLPYSANFNNGQLDLRQRASAIYVFEEALPVETNFGIRYGANSFPDAWAGIRLRLDREKARVLGRVGQQSTRGTTDSVKNR